MPDPIPGLDQFARQAKGSPMLSVQEVRRRGDRRRRGRRAGIAAGSLAVIVVAGVGLWQSPLVDGFNTHDDAVPLPASPSPTTEEPTELPSPSEVPTPSESPTSGDPSSTPDVEPPTWDNVPELDTLIHEQAEGEVTGEYEELDSPDLSLCAPSDFGDPSTVLAREVSFADLDPSVTATVLGFDSVDEATAAFDAAHEASINCDDVYVEEGIEDPRVNDESSGVPFDPKAAESDVVSMSYSTTVGVLPEDENSLGLWTITMVVQADERLLFIQQNFVGMDNNCELEPGGPAGQCTFPANLASYLERLEG